MILIARPRPITLGSYRMFRGSSWSSYDNWYCRSAYRDRLVPSNRDNYLGFRVALRKRLK